MLPVERFSVAPLVGDALVSIIMPLYNEGARIVENVAAVLTSCEEMHLNAEVVLADDGSRDNGFELLVKAYEHHPRVVLVRNETNFGKGWALKTGYEFSRGEYVLFLDSDLELSPWHIPQFLSRLVNEEADAVIGSKLHPESEVNYPFVRRFISFGYYFLIRLLFRLPVMDTQTGIKLFRRGALEAALPRTLVKRFAFDIELLTVMISKGYKVISAPVSLHFNRGGVGNIRLKTVMNVFLDTLAVVYRFYFLRYYRRRLGTPNKYRYRVILFSQHIGERERKNLREYCLLPYPDYDIILLGPHAPADCGKNVRWLHSDAVLYAERLRSHSDVLDESVDAYVLGTLSSAPDKRFFLNTGRLLSLPEVGMVGGFLAAAPDETDEGGFFYQIIRSFFLNGPFTYRYKHAVQKEVLELGLEGEIVKKEVLYHWYSQPSFSAARDKIEHQLAFSCRKLGKTLLYSPDIMMFGYFPQTLDTFWHWVVAQAAARAQQRGELCTWYGVLGVLMALWVLAVVSPWVSYWLLLPWLLYYAFLVVVWPVFFGQGLSRGFSQGVVLVVAQFLYVKTFLKNHFFPSKKGEK